MAKKDSDNDWVTKSLVAKVQAGDSVARAELKRGLILAGRKADVLASPSRRLENAVVKRMSSEPLNSALFEAHAQNMRDELAGPSPSPLEYLLVERIVVTWLLVNQLDLADVCAGSRSLSLAEFDGKRAFRAHRRFLAAVKTLAEVRRLSVPTLQVNIAEKQLNLATVIEADGTDKVPT